MTYTVRTEEFVYTETVVIDDETGEEVVRETNHDAAWYDTRSTETISDEDYEARFL